MRFMLRRTSLFRHSTTVTAARHKLNFIYRNISRLPIFGLVLDSRVQVVQKDKNIKYLVRDPSENDETHTLRPNWTSRD